MKKRIFALVLALLMGVALLAACGNDATSSTPTDVSTPEDGGASVADPIERDPVVGNGETLKVMIMPQGPVDEATQQEVTDAINEILMAELNFQVEFILSGPAWGFNDQTSAMQTGTSDIDLMPAHSWSGVTYTVGAKEGQWVRLDNADGEFGNLLEQYGPNLYAGVSDGLIETATVPGAEGEGIYGVLIEKDIVQQLGYLMNVELLAKYDLTTDDFAPNDFANWGEKLQIIKDGEGKNFYPLNVEPEVLDRTVNYLAYVGNPQHMLGFYFDGANPAGSSNMEIVSRYHSDEYKAFLELMGAYYEAGFIDPAVGVADTSGTVVAEARNSGDFAISTYVYAPGAEKSASDQAGTELAWVPAWTNPVAWTESAMGAGWAVYAGSKNVELSVQFLNLLFENKEVANLLSEGLEGKSYTLSDEGYVSRTDDRGGWNIWRYGIIGDNSAATELQANEWANFKSWNATADVLPCNKFLFAPTEVENEYAACIAVISGYAIPLGSGAMDASNLDAFLAELEDAGIQTVIDEANAQYAAWLAG